MSIRVIRNQTNFASGELAEAVKGRVDLDRYQNGCKTMLNWLPQVQGGARTFPSTVFLASLFGQCRVEPYEAGSADADKFLLVFQDTFLRIYQPDGTSVQTIVSPWTAAQINDLDLAQALSTMIIVHGDHAPRRLYRDAGGTFFLEDLSDTGAASGVFLTNIPSQDAVFRWFPSQIQAVGDLVQPSYAETNGYYYTASSVTGDGKTGSSEPTWPTVIGNTVTDGNVTWTCTGLIADYAAWGDATGWPRCVTFHENRLVLGGTALYPSRLWLSVSGDYFNFDLGSGLDADAIEVELLSDFLEAIEWVDSGRNMTVGTSKGEWATIQADPLTPANFNIRKQSDMGSARVRPARLDGGVIHLVANRSQIRELVYSDVEQSYTTASLSLLNPTALSSVVQMAVKPAVRLDSANLLFAVNSDGTLAVLNVLRDQEITAWCRRSSVGLFESVAVLGDDIYLIVSYTGGPGVYEDGAVYTSDGVYEESGASTYRALVKLDFDTEILGDLLKTVTAGAATDTWAGLGHFAEQEVSCVVDGWYQGEITVSAAGIAVTPVEGTEAVFFFQLPSPTLEPMPVAFDGVRGSIAHLRKRIVRSIVQVVDAYYLTVDGQQIPQIEGGDDLGLEERPSYSGIYEVRHVGWGREESIQLTVAEPFKATVLSWSREVAY